MTDIMMSDEEIQSVLESGLKYLPEMEMFQPVVKGPTVRIGKKPDLVTISVEDGFVRVETFGHQSFDTASLDALYRFCVFVEQNTP